MERRVFTSESVTEGHPDKLCDRIADEILDALLAKDPHARAACEVMVMGGTVVITGEVTADCTIDYAEVARRAILQVGYDDPARGFDGNSCSIFTNIHRQSPDIALGVDRSMEAKAGSRDSADEIGAGDQGMMFGFACDETPERMPAAITLAHQLCRRMALVRKSGLLPWMRPDGKSQVTVEYDDAGHVRRCPAIVIAAQHDPEVGPEEIRRSVLEQVIRPVVPGSLLDKDTQILVNATGRFVTGGPQGDSGLTGRKIIADTYGGAAPHGGASFSGKDPTKMDRSGAYMARYAAKNIVAAGLASRCVVALAYAIGVAHPVSVDVDTQGTGVVSDALLAQYVRTMFDLRPAGIIRSLELRRPIYAPVSAYGHFGRDDLDLPWERTDVAQRTRQALQNGGGLGAWH